jgi:thymidine kinase
MSKLYFRYASMGAGKTLDLLKVAYNYKERGQNVLLLKPSIDTRFDEDVIKSRVGIQEKAITIHENDNIMIMVTKYIYEHCIHNKNKKLSCILIDEIQFFTMEQINQLTDIVDYLNIPIITYGLRVDYRGLPFQSTSLLMALADEIEEVKTICFCGKKATMNALIDLDKSIIIKEGEQIIIDKNIDEIIDKDVDVKYQSNTEYISLCRKHWKSNVFK